MKRINNGIAIFPNYTVRGNEVMTHAFVEDEYGKVYEIIIKDAYQFINKYAIEDFEIRVYSCVLFTDLRAFKTSVDEDDFWKGKEDMVKPTKLERKKAEWFFNDPTFISLTGKTRKYLKYKVGNFKHYETK